MPDYHPGKGNGGALAFKRENVHQNQVWHSEREFEYYDMFLPVTFPAKKINKKCFNNLFSVG